MSVSLNPADLPDSRSNWQEASVGLQVGAPSRLGSDLAQRLDVQWRLRAFAAYKRPDKAPKTTHPCDLARWHNVQSRAARRRSARQQSVVCRGLPNVRSSWADLSTRPHDAEQTRRQLASWSQSAKQNCRSEPRSFQHIQDLPLPSNICRCIELDCRLTTEVKLMQPRHSVCATKQGFGIPSVGVLRRGQHARAHWGRGPIVRHFQDRPRKKRGNFAAPL